MEKNGWERGQDDEELFEFAMHEKQYREFKSGEAKRRFNKELEDKMKAKMEKGGVTVSANELRAMRHPKAEAITAPASGKIIWEIDVVEKSMAPATGKEYKEGDLFCYIQTQYCNEPVYTNWSGKLVDAVAEQGKNVAKGDIIAFIEK